MTDLGWVVHQEKIRGVDMTHFPSAGVCRTGHQAQASSCPWLGPATEERAPRGEAREAVFPETSSVVTPSPQSVRNAKKGK